MKYLTVGLLALLLINCATENTPTYEISISIDPPVAGTVISTPNQTVADLGTSYSLRAEANEGWVFNSWSGDESSTVNPLTFTLDNDKSIIANFEAKSYPLNIEIKGEGIVSEEVIALPKSNDYIHGTLVRLNAIPSEGWIFNKWDEYPDSGKVLELHITEPINLTVNFESKFKLDINGVTIICDEADNGDHGSINGILYTKRSIEQITATNASTTCTSGITNMSGLFKNKSSFNEDISHWDVSKVTDMSEMFYRNTNFQVDISNWDVSNVTNMSYMFYDAMRFKSDISSWITTRVKDMSWMFFRTKEFNQNIGIWDVSNVESMAKMFMSSVFERDISDWDVSSSTDMSHMFSNAKRFNSEIGSWDVSNVSNMESMFNGTNSFNQPIDSWDVSNVTNMNHMFWRAASFNQPINSWDVSKVENMEAMFAETTIFDGELNQWNVSSTNNMINMFLGAQSFNQDLSTWCVINISTEPKGFASSSPLQEDYKPKWGTCPGG